MQYEEREVGEYQGNKLCEYTISNEDITLSALNYGCCITSIVVKDKDGNKENVVAAFDEPASYIDCPGPYLNAIVGPVAGRIAYGTYHLDGVEKHLSTNSKLNHLHGGAQGVSKRLFDVHLESEDNKSMLIFTLTCSHKEDGYEGMFHYEIKYILEQNKFSIEYNCTPTKKTILNMTTHLYFNLSGDMKRSIEQQKLLIPSSKFLKTHVDAYPYCVSNIVEQSALDFNKLIGIKENFDKGHKEFQFTKGYDSAFLLNKNQPICLKDIESGRCLNIHSDQRSVVVYTANYFNDSLILNKKQKGYPFCCIALETQDAPNGINIDELVHYQVFDQEHPYYQLTQYVFTIEE